VITALSQSFANS